MASRASPRIRVLTADDHAILRAGVRMLINAQPDMTVVAEATNGQEAVTLCEVHRPDVAILDQSMPVTTGIRAAGQIHESCPRTRILILTMHADPEYLRSAVAAGAAGYLTKRAADLELIQAIRTIHSGRPYIDSSLGFSLIERLSSRKSDAGESPRERPLLSRREEEVLTLLARGHTNQEVADRLFLSVKSIETYRARLAQKLGLKRRADLVRYALEIGLLAPSKE